MSGIETVQNGVNMFKVGKVMFDFIDVVLVFLIVNFEHIPHLFPEFLLMNLMLSGLHFKKSHFLC